MRTSTWYMSRNRRATVPLLWATASQSSAAFRVVPEPRPLRAATSSETAAHLDLRKRASFARASMCTIGHKLGRARRRS
jgi:hypothetical protein